MTYRIGGTAFSVQPTQGRWLPRVEVGTDGNGRPIYSAVREFEITWGLLEADEVNQIQNFFAAVGATGTAVVSLPKYADSTYVFYDYTGCVLREPQFNHFFATNTTEVTLLVTKIRT